MPDLVKQIPLNWGFCDTCSMLRNGEYQLLKIHLESARIERLEYRNQVALCKSKADQLHLSFDFALPIRLPRQSLPEPTRYLKSLFQVALFAVGCESGQMENHFFLLPEHQWPEFENFPHHSSSSTQKFDQSFSSVLSMICEVFLKIPESISHLWLHADNNTSQNKNIYVLFFLSWFALVRNITITYSFMTPGHTHFYPDACLGVIRRKLKTAEVYSIEQLNSLIKESSERNVTIENPSFFNFGSFLSQYFQCDTNFPLHDFNQFTFSHTTPGNNLFFNFFNFFFLKNIFS